MNDKLISDVDLKAFNKFNHALLNNIPVCLIINEGINGRKYTVTGYKLEHYLVGENLVSIYGYSEDNPNIREIGNGYLSTVLQALKVVENNPVYKSLFD